MSDLALETIDLLDTERDQITNIDDELEDGGASSDSEQDVGVAEKSANSEELDAHTISKLSTIQKHLSRIVKRVAILGRGMQQVQQTLRAQFPGAVNKAKVMADDEGSCTVDIELVDEPVGELALNTIDNEPIQAGRFEVMSKTSGSSLDLSPSSDLSDDRTAVPGLEVLVERQDDAVQTTNY